MFKASQLVNFCLDMVGMPYWYGTCVYPCTSSLLSRKAKQYSSHYGSSRTSRYKKDISDRKVCMDCVGMIKGFFWTNGGVGVREYINGGEEYKSKYGSNGCPDKSASGMLSWAKSKGCKHGKIAALPEVPGVLLFAPGHVGVYAGNGYAVEARGFNYGVVKTKVKDRKWADWAYMPESVLDYSDTADVPAETPSTPSETPEVKPTPEKITHELGERTLKRGSEGDDVRKLQEYLVKLGYDLGSYGSKKDGVDGDMGSKTVNAVKGFQAAHDLEVDGKYGKKTHAAMLEAIKNIGEDGTTTDFAIKVKSWSVNVRNAPNTSTGKVMRVVRMNTLLTAVGVDPATGWYKLSDGNYISNKYTCRV